MTDAEEIIKEREKAIIRKKEKQVALKEARYANQQTLKHNANNK